MSHPLILLELLENIFSFLAKDKALYPALFVNRLCKDTSGPLYWQLRKFKRVMCGKTKPPYCSKMVYLKLAGLKISDELLSAILHSCPDINFLILDRSHGFSNIPIIEIAKYCLKLLHLSLDACTAITDRCISEIAQSCPNLKYISLASLYRDSNISSASVIEIARSCSNLVYLNLNRQPSINDKSICAIACSCVNLQHLDLSFNEIIIDEAICAIATG
ncbi:3700_t:CDS:2 [Cetraspora pellucida]|uniref:3700_t:CDS:1 n=1 Tax=Cetraspora pellucida TaxID=1433469 RepID=A0ACA9N7L0_9GLOM|nr:3700_t:CDS:2 [Cetraspora pellucida]